MSLIPFFWLYLFISYKQTYVNYSTLDGKKGHYFPDVITANFAKIWKKLKENLNCLTCFILKVCSFCQSYKR